jgi:hypothetical protein
MLPILLTVIASVATAPAVADAASQDPAIRVWLNKGDYIERTEKVRAYVRTGVDGYVVILHAEPSGRVRVLFPLDPDDDAWVRAGRDYEVRSRGDQEAFRIYDGTGPGVVVAAVSRDPFRFDGLALNRHWDYRSAAFGVGNDPEADLLALVQQMSGGAWFDYDVTRYQIREYGADYYVADGGDGTVHLSFYGPAYAGHYWTGGVGFSIGFGVGWWDPWYWYDPWYSGPCCGYGWYSPWYGYGYYPWYGYGYSPWRGYAYYPAYPYYPGYGYPPGYYAPVGPNYPSHYYAAGSYATGYYASQSGAWGSYAFKSQNDRYGLNQNEVTARRRAPGTGGAYASTSTSASAGGRRTTAASSPASAGTPAGASVGRRTTAASSPASPATQPGTAAGRRTTAASSPASGGTARGTGSLEARRPAGTSSEPTTLPTINGRGRTPDTPAGVTRQGPAGSTADGRRGVVPSTATPPSGDVTRGRAPSEAGSQASSARRPASSAGIREIAPQRVGTVPSRSEVNRSGTRGPQGTVGSGSTTRSSTGSLERRTPSKSAAPSRAPSRSVSPPSSTPSTRSTPSRPAPSTRSAPSRSSGSRASPPARSSGGRSSPPSSGRATGSSGGRRR